MICCIPSKGRPGTNTYKLFQQAGIPVYHFIEPQEMDAYKAPNKISIGESNKGIAFVRNFILDWARANGHEWIIMCDDDITKIHKYIDGKNVEQTASIFLQVWEKVKQLPFELVGFNYKQYIWVAKTDYSVNSVFVDQLVMINVKRVTWRYRGEFNMKEDRDFAMQTIQKGNGVLRFNKIGINSPLIGTNPGGLQEDYKLKRDELNARKMVNEWFPFCKLENKDGRVDFKADLKALAKQYKKTIR